MVDDWVNIKKNELEVENLHFYVRLILVRSKTDAFPLNYSQLTLKLEEKCFRDTFE